MQNNLCKLLKYWRINNMRLDKYLKTARILKRREAAKELALQGRIWVNDRVAKPSTELQIGDKIRIQFGTRILIIQVLDIQKQVSKQNAQLLFEILSEERIGNYDEENE